MSLKPLSCLVACLAALPLWAEPVEVAYPEFPIETAALVAATEALFDELEATPATNPLRIKTLEATIEPIAQAPTEAARAALEPALGPVRDLTAYGITWYPTDRLMGTVDFVGTWRAGMNLVCGYVTWDLSNPDAPELVEIETTYLKSAELVNLPDVAARGALLHANCAFGAVEPNLELARFDTSPVN